MFFNCEHLCVQYCGNNCTRCTLSSLHCGMHEACGVLLAGVWSAECVAGVWSACGVHVEHMCSACGARLECGGVHVDHVWSTLECVCNAVECMWSTCGVHVEHACSACGERVECTWTTCSIYIHGVIILCH